MTAPPVQPAIPVNSSRNVALSGAVLAAVLVVRSPLSGRDGWGWLLLGGVALLRLAFGDRTALRARRREGVLSWIPMVFVIPILFLDRNYQFALALTTCYLLILSLARAADWDSRLHPLHYATWAAAFLLLVEAFGRFLLRDRTKGSTFTWTSFGGDPWQEFLPWIGVLVLVTALIIWIEQTRHLDRSLRSARDHALRLKLAPHFIFNTLNTLKAQLERAPREAVATVDRLAALYRQLLDRTERPTVPLREELAFVEAYLGIEQVRLGGRLRVVVEVPEALEALQVPTLSLQALVENAVKHGIAPRVEGGTLVIRAAPYGDDQRWIRVSVEIPAPPAGAQRTAPGTDIGLETLRARLASPSALRTEVLDGRFLAEYLWAPPEVAT